MPSHDPWLAHEPWATAIARVSRLDAPVFTCVGAGGHTCGSMASRQVCECVDWATEDASLALAGESSGAASGPANASMPMSSCGLAPDLQTCEPRSVRVLLAPFQSMLYTSTVCVAHRARG